MNLRMANLSRGRFPFQGYQAGRPCTNRRGHRSCPSLGQFRCGGSRPRATPLLGADWVGRRASAPSAPSTAQIFGGEARTIGASPRKIPSALPSAGRGREAVGMFGLCAGADDADDADGRAGSFSGSGRMSPHGQRTGCRAPRAPHHPPLSRLTSARRPRRSARASSV